MRFKFFVWAGVMLAIAGCRQAPPGLSVERGFYFWRSRFELAPEETQALKQLQTKNLYVKFFDVEWDEHQGKAQPVAKIKFTTPWPVNTHCIPVVFITNETLQHASPEEVGTLALHIVQLLQSIHRNNGLPATQEIQIDCDWTASTKDRYFLLLKQLRKTAFMAKKTLSATIRLHQVKYISQSGIPPVDKGLLMCYNMGNLQQAQTPNSIIDPALLKQYIGNAKQYPLPLDIGLPIFNWWVWFSGSQYRGLLQGDALQLPLDKRQQWHCQTDTTINGYSFKAGDWLRFESSPAESIQKSVALLLPQLNSSDIHVVLYHLDAKMLAQYETSTLETFYTGFHR